MIKLKCSTCGLLKLENEFSRDRYTKRKGRGTRSALYGRTYDCLVCIRKKRKELYERNPQLRVNYNARKREKYKEPEEQKRQRKAMLKLRYNLTPEEYDTLLKSQNKVCAICNTGNTHKRHKYLHVDHNHITGHVRGLLCHQCNTLIGNSKDSIDILNKAIHYLNRHLDTT